MSGFNPVDIYIFVGKNSTTHRCNTYRVVFKAHFINNLAHELVNDTVTTTGTVVHGTIVEQTRTTVDLIALFYYIFLIHLCDIRS